MFSLVRHNPFTTIWVVKMNPRHQRKGVNYCVFHFMLQVLPFFTKTTNTIKNRIILQKLRKCLLLFFLFKQEKGLIISGKFCWKEEIVPCQFPKRDLTWPAGTTPTTTKRVNPARPRLLSSTGTLLRLYHACLERPSYVSMHFF